jgi:hypothetical protein
MVSDPGEGHAVSSIMTMKWHVLAGDTAPARIHSGSGTTTPMTKTRIINILAALAVGIDDWRTGA